MTVVKFTSYEEARDLLATVCTGDVGGTFLCDDLV